MKYQKERERGGGGGREWDVNECGYLFDKTQFNLAIYPLDIMVAGKHNIFAD